MNQASSVTGTGATAIGSGSASQPSYSAGASPANLGNRLPGNLENQAAFDGWDPATADRQTLMKTAWGKARDVVAKHPAASLAVGLTLGGLVGWLTSKLK